MDIIVGAASAINANGRQPIVSDNIPISGDSRRAYRVAGGASIIDDVNPIASVGEGSRIIRSHPYVISDYGIITRCVEEYPFTRTSGNHVLLDGVGVGRCEANAYTSSSTVAFRRIKAYDIAPDCGIICVAQADLNVCIVCDHIALPCRQPSDNHIIGIGSQQYAYVVGMP